MGDMWFTRHDDGSITVHDVQAHPSWSLALLEHDHDGDYLTWADGVVTVRAANGTWRWREIGRDDLGYGHTVVRTELLSDAEGPSPAEENPR